MSKETQKFNIIADELESVIKHLQDLAEKSRQFRIDNGLEVCCEKNSNADCE